LDFPVTGNAAQLNPGGNGDVFVARVKPGASPASFLVYSSYFGGTDGEVGYGVAPGPGDSIYVTGYTLSADLPITADAIQSGWGYGIDSFVAKWNSAGALEYSTYLGPTGIHVAVGLGVAADGTVAVAGYTTPGITTTGSGWQPNYAGGFTDGFVLALQ
jgi:hypothetical protein